VSVVHILGSHGRDFAEALFRGLMNSEDTTALLNGEEISSVWQMPRILPIMEGHPEGREILRDRPIIRNMTKRSAFAAHLVKAPGIVQMYRPSGSGRSARLAPH